MKPIELRTLRDLVTEDYRAAQVLRKYNLDFCCKGNRTLHEMAQLHQIDLTALLEEIKAKQQPYPAEIFGFRSWPLDLLMEYINAKHHKYILERIPILQQYLKRLGKLHGNTNPELFEILELFTQTGQELPLHIQKEKSLIFPLIRAMVKYKSTDQCTTVTIAAQLSHLNGMMREEHRLEIARFRKIALLSQDFYVPDHGCSLYRITYSMLKEFEDDLMEHIHLENNILFPKAELMAKQFLDSSDICH